MFDVQSFHCSLRVVGSRSRICADILPITAIILLTCLKQINKAQRHPYWTFDVGRSMFDVQSFHYSGQAEFHTSVQDMLLRLPVLILVTKFPGQKQFGRLG